MTKDVDIARSYNKTIDILKGSDNSLKPFALLELKELEHEDYGFFIKHLTNCEGNLREIAAMKLVEFPPKPVYYPVLVDALCDINPNVCRRVVEALSVLKLDLYAPTMVRIEEILNEIEMKSKPKKWRTQKNHLLTKKFFNLYWCLEALSECLCAESDERLIDVLQTCTEFDDYTIREKAAKIAVKMQQAGVLLPKELIEKLRNDENYYVKMNFENF